MISSLAQRAPKGIDVGRTAHSPSCPPLSLDTRTFARDPLMMNDEDRPIKRSTLRLSCEPSTESPRAIGPDIAASKFSISFCESFDESTARYVPPHIRASRERKAIDGAQPIPMTYSRVDVFIVCAKLKIIASFPIAPSVISNTVRIEPSARLWAVVGLLFKISARGE